LIQKQALSILRSIRGVCATLIQLKTAANFLLSFSYEKKEKVFNFLAVGGKEGKIIFCDC
jgi:hypothetical protein